MTWNGIGTTFSRPLGQGSDPRPHKVFHCPDHNRHEGLLHSIATLNSLPPLGLRPQPTPPPLFRTGRTRDDDGGRDVVGGVVVGANLLADFDVGEGDDGGLVAVAGELGRVVAGDDGLRGRADFGGRDGDGLAVNSASCVQLLIHGRRVPANACLVRHDGIISQNRTFAIRMRAMRSRGSAESPMETGAFASLTSRPATPQTASDGVFALPKTVF